MVGVNELLSRGNKFMEECQGRNGTRYTNGFVYVIQSDSLVRKTFKSVVQNVGNLLRHVYKTFLKK